MPRRSKGPRLWLRPARRDRKGRISHAPSYFILDRGRQISTGISELPEAEQALAAYIQEKYRRQTTETLRDTSKIPIADVIAVYATDIAPNHTRPEDTKRRLARIPRGSSPVLALLGAVQLPFP